MGSGDWNSPPLPGASILPREQAISLALVSSLLRWGLSDVLVGFFLESFLKIYFLNASWQ